MWWTATTGRVQDVNQTILACFLPKWCLATPTFGEGEKERSWEPESFQIFEGKMGGREGGEGRFGENKAALNLKKTAHYISSHNLHTSSPLKLWFPSLKAFSLQKILWPTTPIIWKQFKGKESKSESIQYLVEKGIVALPLDRYLLAPLFKPPPPTLFIFGQHCLFWAVKL